LVEETGVPRENHWLAEVIDKLYHIMLYRVHLAWRDSKTHNFSGREKNTNLSFQIIEV
jgi:hypothetical protein